MTSAAVPRSVASPEGSMWTAFLSSTFDRTVRERCYKNSSIMQKNKSGLAYGLFFSLRGARSSRGARNGSIPRGLKAIDPADHALKHPKQTHNTRREVGGESTGGSSWGTAQVRMGALWRKAKSSSTKSFSCRLSSTSNSSWRMRNLLHEVEEAIAVYFEPRWPRRWASAITRLHRAP